MAQEKVCPNIPNTDLVELYSVLSTQYSSTQIECQNVAFDVEER